MNVWFDSEIKDIDKLKISCLSHTLHYGTGVFEGIRAYEVNNKATIFRLDAHIERLFKSAKIIGMPILYSHEEITQAIHEVLRSNQLTNAYIRPLLFYGSGGMGLDVKSKQPNPVHLLITAWKWDSYFSSEEKSGVNAFVSSWKRVFSNPKLAQAKAVGHYLNSFLAYSEAKKNGCDEAILLDEKEIVSEGSASNLFIIKDGRIATPKVSSALKGITRDTIFALAREMKIEIEECDISVNRLLQADEAFFTGTACEISNIASINGIKLPGSLTNITAPQLSARYSQLVHMKYEFSKYCPQDFGQWFSIVENECYDTNHCVA
ncbi:MAG: branched-chain amino acid transaminase [Gammaproteobacteria bacterium]|nr:branched-chain amino acid transaminase [Gammaproteobacteria bacterium]